MGKNEREREKKKRNIIHAAQQGVRLSPVFRTASLKRLTVYIRACIKTFANFSSNGYGKSYQTAGKIYCRSNFLNFSNGCCNGFDI